MVLALMVVQKDQPRELNSPKVTQSRLVSALEVFVRLDKSSGSADVRRWCCYSVFQASLLFIKHLCFVLALFGWFPPFLANSTACKAVDAFGAFDAFDAIGVCCRRRSDCLVVYILASSYLILLFGAFFVQKVIFCPFLSNLAKSESGGAVYASTTTNALAVGAERVLQPLQTCFLAPSWPFGLNTVYLRFFRFVQ